MQESEEAIGVWVSLSELGRRRNISRASVKERVDRLEAQGLVVTKRDGKKRLVELATFDRAIGYAGDLRRELAAETVKSSSTSMAYRDAQAERARYEAQLKALDLAERQRLLLPVVGEHGIAAAAGAIGDALTRDLDGMVHYADDLATAVSKEGVAGARRLLKEIGVKVRQQVADSLSKIASMGAAAERGGPIEVDLLDMEFTPTDLASDAALNRVYSNRAKGTE